MNKRFIWSAIWSALLSDSCLFVQTEPLSCGCVWLVYKVCWEAPPPPLYEDYQSQTAKINCLWVHVLRHGNSLNLVTPQEWVKLPQDGVSVVGLLPPSVHAEWLRMHAHCRCRAPCLTPTPHAYTLEYSAAENVFLISAPLWPFHFFLPSSPYVIT